RHRADGPAKGLRRVVGGDSARHPGEPALRPPLRLPEPSKEQDEDLGLANKRLSAAVQAAGAWNLQTARISQPLREESPHQCRRPRADARGNRSPRRAPTKTLVAVEFCCKRDRDMIIGEM